MSGLLPLASRSFHLHTTFCSRLQPRILQTNTPTSTGWKTTHSQTGSERLLRQEEVKLLPRQEEEEQPRCGAAFHRSRMKTPNRICEDVGEEMSERSHGAGGVESDSLLVHAPQSLTPRARSTEPHSSCTLHRASLLVHAPQSLTPRARSTELHRRVTPK